MPSLARCHDCRVSRFYPHTVIAIAITEIVPRLMQVCRSSIVPVQAHGRDYLGLATEHSVFEERSVIHLERDQRKAVFMRRDIILGAKHFKTLFIYYLPNLPKMRVRLLVCALLVSACLAITGPQKPRATTLVAAADDVKKGLVLQSSSDVPASVFNLAKTILGAGILSLPSGVAAFTDDVGGLWPASGLLVVMGLISAYSFASIGRACRLHDVRTFSDAWGKSVGPKSAVVISSVITLKTFFSCLAFSIIIGDSFSSIFKSFGLPAVLTTRTNVILGLTSLVIFPLCLLKNLDALKTTSIMGLGGIVYCALFMAVRLVDGSYRGPNGRFFKDISDAVKPSFNQRVTTAAAASSSSSHAIFVLISMLSTAFVAHYNAPKFWAELKNKTAQRYHTVIASAFGFAAAMYLSVMWTGFLTFGGHSTGFILNNYSGKDAFATVARICIGLAILFGYPLVFSALREGLFDLLRLPAVGDARAKHNVPATAVLMALITALALKLTNLGLVVSLSGALIGAMLIYFVPAVMNICNIKKEADAATKVKGNKSATVRYTRKQHTELLANYAMGLMGILIAVNGVATTLMSAGGGAH